MDRLNTEHVGLLTEYEQTFDLSTVKEVAEAAEKGTLKECFGTGTAAVVSPVGELVWEDKHIVVSGGEMGKLTGELYDTLTGIQYGRIEDPFGWVKEICK